MGSDGHNRQPHLPNVISSWRRNRMGSLSIDAAGRHRSRRRPEWIPSANRPELGIGPICLSATEPGPPVLARSFADLDQPGSWHSRLPRHTDR